MNERRGARPSPLGPPLAGLAASRLPLPPPAALGQPDARCLLPGADRPSTLAAAAGDKSKVSKRGWATERRRPLVWG